MPDKTRESAVHDAAVGAAADEPISNSNTSILAHSAAKINSNSDFSEEEFDMDRVLARINDPNYLHTLSMNQLYDTTYQNRPVVIEGLLYSGTYIFAGAPKVGKSFFMAQLAYHVSTGKKLWEYEVHQGTVLYLALEDDYQRIQERMYRMFGVEGTDHLHFAICAKQLGKGLDEQMTAFLREHPDTRLVIIDTLQKVRELSVEAYSYASDYDVISRMKQFADSSGICLMLVHHTRKRKADDQFEMISGTTGILGSADGAFLLHKENRTDLSATLDVVGRDQPDQRLYLTRDQEKLSWDLDHAETELWKQPPDPVLERINAILETEWAGTTTELLGLLSLDMRPNAFSRYLNVNKGRLLRDYSIDYGTRRTHSGRTVTLKRIP